MLKKNILGTLVLTSTVVLTNACSDNDHDHDNIDQRIAAIDTDGNLVVSTSEWNAAFATFDTNHDGLLTTVEFRFNATGFASADVNGDGLVSQAEWDATMARWDVNSDLVLEEAEFVPFL